MRTDHGSDWPNRLLSDLNAAPLVSEEWLSRTRTPRTIAGAVQQYGDTLTPRQLDVIRCHAHGLDGPMTAEALGVTLATVESHLKLVRYKLRAKNTTHAVAQAIRSGLV